MKAVAEGNSAGYRIAVATEAGSDPKAQKREFYWAFASTIRSARIANPKFPVLQAYLAVDGLFHLSASDASFHQRLKAAVPVWQLLYMAFGAQLNASGQLRPESFLTAVKVGSNGLDEYQPRLEEILDLDLTSYNAGEVLKLALSSDDMFSAVSSIVAESGFDWLLLTLAADDDPSSLQVDQLRPYWVAASERQELRKSQRQARSVGNQKWYEEWKPPGL